MIEQATTQTKRRTQPKPLSAAAVAMIRIVNDAVLFAIALVAIFNIKSGEMKMGIQPPTVSALIHGLILLGSIIAFLLIRSNRIKLGINLLIYSLIIGMFINSVFFENLSSFGFVMTLFFTILTIYRSLSFREGVPPIVSTIIAGVAGIAVDTIFEGATFRAQPVLGSEYVWVLIAFFALLTIYMIIRLFPVFTLRAKLISSFVLVTLLSLGLLLLSTTLSLQQILTTEADEALFAAASQTSDSIEDSINNYKQTIESLATLPVVIDYTSNPEGADSRVIDDLLNIFSSQQDVNVLSYALIDINGAVIADSIPENVGTQTENFDYFFETLQSVSTVVTDVYYDPDLDEPVIYITTPILRRNISVVGILRLKLNASFLQDLIERSNGLVGEDSFAVLFDEHLIHLGHGTHPETLFTAVAPLSDTIFSELKAEQRLPDLDEDSLFMDLFELETNLRESQVTESQATYFNATDIATGDRLDRVAVVKVDGAPWLLSFFQPQDIYLQPLSTLGDSSVFFFIIAGLFATGIGLLLTQAIVRPLAYLNRTASLITEGDFSSRVDIISQDEIGSLGNTFNMMAIQLQNLIVNLESQVSDRTKELQDQTIQLRTTAEIARDATSEEELNFLLERATYLLYDRFSFYHVGIYLIDGRGQYAILSSSQDPQGLQLISNEHKYLIDLESSVGRAVSTGIPQVSNIEHGSGVHQHPLLPDTQAQLSLPLQVAGKTLGVIDIHSTNPRDFSEEEVGIFSTFSDQIAIAIQRTEFSHEIQQTLDELESAYGQFTQESWRRFIQGKRDQFSGYRFRQLSVEPLESQPSEVVQAWEAGEVISLTHAEDGTSIMAIPMKVRGEVIGVLDLEFETDLIPPDTQNLMTEIADRLSLVLENARLIASAQEQVERQQLAAHLTNRISQSLDLDTVLRTATQEIGETLGLAEVEVRLGSMDLGFQMSDNGDGIPEESPSQPPPPINPGPVDSGINEDDHEPIH